MYYLTGKKLLFAALLSIFVLMGCNHNDNPESKYNFASTFFEASDCSDAYWMLERDGESYFVLDSDMPDTPARRQWRQNARPDDGVGTVVESPELIVDTITVGWSTDLLACMTYSELLDVALPNEWFDADGNCINWPPPQTEPPTVPEHEHPLPDHGHGWPAHEHPHQHDWDHEHEWPDHVHPDDDCEEDDNNGHGNDCDHDDDGNPGKKHDD